MAPSYCDIGRTATARPRASASLKVDELSKQLCRVVAEGFGDLTELDHVNPALTSLDLRYEALWASEAIGELHLSDARGLASRDEELNELLMPLREER